MTILRWNITARIITKYRHQWLFVRKIIVQASGSNTGKAVRLFRLLDSLDSLA